MDFVKKHYEKILLGIVLLGLVGALGILPFWILQDQAELERTRQTMTSPTVQPLPPLDLTEQNNAIQRLQSPYKLNFETTNRLFNPVKWQMKPNGTRIKIESGKEVGPQAVEIIRISPLYSIFTLDSGRQMMLCATKLVSNVKRRHHRGSGPSIRILPQLVKKPTLSPSLP